MFLKTAATALTVLLIATSAHAQSVSQGDAQLAAIAGVPAGALSTPDLVNLINAQRDNDQDTVNFILSKVGIGATRAGGDTAGTAAGSGWDMVARLNGVAPGEYTASELAEMDYKRLD